MLLEKEQLKSVGKTTSIVGLAAAAILGVTYLVIPPQPVTQKVHELRWDYEPITLKTVQFEFITKTNINGPWLAYRTVVGTNVLFVTNKLTETLGAFTIGRVVNRYNTNDFITWDGL